MSDEELQAERDAEIWRKAERHVKTDYYTNPDDIHVEERIEPVNGPLSSLNPEQRARTAAICLAKPLLVYNHGDSSSPPEVNDLIQAAQWIVTGQMHRPEFKEGQRYPAELGDVILLGPEIFAAADGRVICWQGQNYTIQPEEKNLDLD